MDALATFGFLLLVTYAVWEGTEQRPGTRDELRMLVGLLMGMAIVGGSWSPIAG